MKKFLALIVAVSTFAAASAQNKSVAKASPAPAAQATAKTPIEFKESKFSFGKVKQNVPVTHVFTFKNTSNTPVVIESATAQCGCTTPEYPKGVIAKGATEKIKVTYNAASMGAFTKQVTIRLAKYAEPIILTIDGEVVAAPATKEKTGK